MYNKSAVVTGCLSFIGVALTEKLLREDWQVYGIDKLTYVANTKLISYFKTTYKDNFTLVSEDIKDVKWLPACDVVFNIAAESDVDNGNKDCSQFISSNIEGVRNLLSLINSRIITKADKPLFFQMSTDEVYGDLEEGVFDENAPLRPSNPYAATKASADLLIQSWARTHGLEYLIARPSNNYGYYQYPEKLIPLAVKQLSRGKKIKLHNEGKPIRSWTHSEDTAEAILTLYDNADRNKVYNISSEYEQTNLDTVKKIINSYFLGTISREVPNYTSHIDLEYSRPGQDVRYAISCNPLKELQWRPKKEFNQEIVKLVENYKKGWTW
jgi:dTDP-glucose 4,6-dehydratase